MKPLALLLALSLLLLRPLPAQESATLRIQGGGASGPVLVTAAGDANAENIIKTDLRLMGMVPVADSPATAALTAQIIPLGNQAHLRLTTRDGQIYADENLKGRDPRHALHLAADAIVLAATGRPGAAAGTIAFISNRTGRKELYACDFDGGNIRQITRDASIVVSPALSPDGRKVAYTSYRSGYPDVYVASTQGGGGGARIVSAPGTNSGASFSPDGGSIALTMSSTGNPELCLVGSGGGGGSPLTRTPGVESSPTWGPDGREIIFSSDTRGGSPQLYRMALGGSGVRPLPTGHSYCTEPSWSPDGSKVAFNIRAGGSFQVAILDLRSGATRVITSGGDAEDPAWGPNSRHLIYRTSAGLILHDTETGRAIPLLANYGRITEPTWSRK